MVNDDVKQHAKAIKNIKHSEVSEAEKFMEISDKINEGMLVEEVLDYAYDSMRSIIEYDRMCFALVDDMKIVRAMWANSNYDEIKLNKGYEAPLEGSTLEKLLDSKVPRIINNLEEYTKEHPGSESTQLIIEEGIMSSLTCPLVALGKPVGFLFFSSTKPGTYRDAHVEIFMPFAKQFSMVVEKSMLYQSELEANDLKNKFLGITAHDLRNPLAVVQGYLECFLDGIVGDVTEEQRDIFVKMFEVSKRMLTMVNNLLDISAIEAGTITLDKKDVDIKEYLGNLQEYNNLIAKKKDIAIELKLDSQLKNAKLDTDAISQVINNLVTNAIKFSTKNTTITIEAKKIGEKMQIAVIDQGQGIPEDEQGGLFGYFNKTTVKATNNEAGAGLGLAIVKKMVEAHGGKVSIESKVGEGSTFSFEIPLFIEQ